MFKPMLAGKADLDNIKFPVMASPKLDGVRVLIRNEVVVSRNIKLIPNKHVQKLFGTQMCNGLDGELIVGKATASNVFQATTSGVMTVDGEPDVKLYVFDYTLCDYPFNKRHKIAVSKASKLENVEAVKHVIVNNIDELLKYEELCIKRGYEGIMIRDPDGLYKHGRSTTREGGLLKVKRFDDDEAVVVDFIESMHNQNPSEVNALGIGTRSVKKAGMIPAGTLGALIVESDKFGRFSIGSGFNDEQRQSIWDNREDIKGLLVKFKYQQSGMKDKPRFPIFLGFRHKIDK